MIGRNMCEYVAARTNRGQIVLPRVPPYGLEPPRTADQAVMRDVQDLFGDDDGVYQVHLTVHFGPRRVADIRLDTEGQATTGVW